LIADVAGADLSAAGSVDRVQLDANKIKNGKSHAVGEIDMRRFIIGPLFIGELLI
jgi:hypothetical protein